MKKRTSSRQNPKPAAKAKRAQQSVTIGMDLGDRNSRYCVLSEEGEILREGQVATTKAGMTGGRCWCKERTTSSAAGDRTPI
jgi:hypothetical protein